MIDAKLNSTFDSMNWSSMIYLTIDEEQKK